VTPPPRGGDTLSGAAPARAPRMDRQRVGSVREQPPREVLQAHHRGARAIPCRGAVVAPARGSDRRRVATNIAGAGLTPAPGWRRLLRLSLGSRSIERDVDDELAFHLACEKRNCDDLASRPRRPAPKRMSASATRAECASSVSRS